ncbi:MAG: AI-2E family transporter [Bombella apis]|uniref:AI-2E family transporter n=1 Tax=Bombella apis TaxID=1785988 RepID=UPI0023EF5B1A|nr:AI-2E family transporter [Bombella apis]MCT6820393.1 AI-2E family transporter [Bombella apis]
MITRFRNFFASAEATTRAAVSPVRPVLTALAVGLLLLAAVWIIHPFLPPILWGATISVTLWPLVQRLQTICFGSRSAAVFFTVLAAMIIFFLPAVLVIVIFARHVDAVSHFIGILPTIQPPAAPAWVGRIPYVGGNIIPFWDHLRENSLPELLKQVIPSPEKILHVLLASAGSFGSLLLEFALTLIVMVLLLGRAEGIIMLLDRIGGQLGGRKGRALLKQAEITTRGVALGVTLTAILESLFGWVGLMAAGMPMGSVVAAVMFISCVLQFGGAWVMILSTVWLYFTAPLMHAIIMLLFALVVIAGDNFLQPLIIRRYVRISVIVIMVGAFGGLSTLGFAGVFIGPTLLYLTETMIRDWAGLPADDEKAGQADASADASES